MDEHKTHRAIVIAPYGICVPSESAGRLFHGWHVSSAIIDHLMRSSPRTFWSRAGSLIPWFAAAAAIVCMAGLYLALFVAPTDAQHGEVYRVIFIHVPAAWLSMLIYLVVAFWMGVGLASNTQLSAIMTQALAPTGALFTFLAF